MCVVSMVSTHFEPNIPWVDITRPWPNPWEVVPEKISDKPDQDLEKVLRDFAEAMKAAKKVDELTGKPDCVDPEKSKLEERVKELTDLLNSKTEFVVLKRQNMQPGKYRVLDGKIYKVLE